MSGLEPVLSSPGGGAVLSLGGSSVVRRIRSEETRGSLAVVEFVSAPGEGVDVHVHRDEDELVYLLEGEIEVSLGEGTMRVSRGACALLPRGIPHGYVNVGRGESRLLAVLLPGRLDGFFVGLDRVLSSEGPHEESIERLARMYGLGLSGAARS